MKKAALLLGLAACGGGGGGGGGDGDGGDVDGGSDGGADAAVDGGEGGVSWRLPCGGEYYPQGALLPEWWYRYEYDAAGHLTKQEELTASGSVTWTYEWRWEGDILVYWRRFSTAESHEYERVLEGGRIVRFIARSPDPDSDFVEVWTWNGDDLARIDRDYSDPALADHVETFAATADGYASLRCATGASTCDRYGIVGAEYVGDDRWPSTYLFDAANDGVIEVRVEYTYDEHRLPQVRDRYRIIDGSLALWEQQEYEREPDGTALRRWTRWWFPERVSRLEYVFECP